MKSWLAPASLLAMSAVVNCGSGDNIPQGTEKGPCYPNLTCNAGLTCLSDTCVNAGGIPPSGAGGAPGSGLDAGPDGVPGSGFDAGPGGVQGQFNGPPEAVSLDAAGIVLPDGPLGTGGNLDASSLEATASGGAGAASGGSGDGVGDSGGAGGVMGTGGRPETGGATGTGGASTTTIQPPATVDCTDTSTMTTIVSQQYGANVIALDGNTSKNYYFQANWWNSFAQEAESISGVGFTISNPTGAASASNNPLGFPSIYIGAYQGRNTKGSNLPKQVSTLTSVPTIFRTNASSVDTSNLNATYDVWLSASSSGVADGAPGIGGAYLMVWLYKPSKRQPRGSVVQSGAIVQGIPGTWNVWYDNTNPPCVSYVSATALSELQFDLNDFIQDAVSNKWGVTSSQYLSLVFAGSEVWGGGDGFQVKQFCANVK